MRDRRLTAAGVLIAAASVTLFVWALEQAGLEPVRAAAGRIGAGFIVIVLLGGLRGSCRALAWTYAVGPQERLTPWRAVTAYFAGEALGNITPFGPLASEPVRIVLVNSQLAVGAALSARAVETMLYGVTIVLMWVIGAGTLLVAFSAPGASKLTVGAMLVGAGAATLAAAWFVRAHGLVARIVERLMASGVVPAMLEQAWVDLRRPGSGILELVGRHPGRTLRILGLEALYHVAAVAEIWVTLRLITGHAPTLPTALVLECFNRAIMIGFQFVPMWLGVDEAGTGLVASALHLGAATGVTLALVRKARIICWTAVGLLVALAQGLTVGAGGVAPERPVSP